MNYPAVLNSRRTLGWEPNASITRIETIFKNTVLGFIQVKTQMLQRYMLKQRE